jgi:thiol:disulfide interchange protein DsbD
MNTPGRWRPGPRAAAIGTRLPGSTELWPSVATAAAHATRAAGVLAIAVAILAAQGAGPQSATAATMPAQVVELSGSISSDPAGGVAVEARVAIAAGFHINAHRPDADYLIPTVLTLSAEGATFEPPVYPEPEARAFAFSEGRKLLVYDGTILIRARGPSLPSGPVRAELRYQACDDERCLPPKTVQATLGPRESAAAAAAPAAGAGTEGAAANPADGDGSTGAGATTTRSGGWVASWLATATLPAALAMTFVLGLTLNLTPCVYPLISVTVAYFGGQAGTQRRAMPLAAAYVAGITLSFAALGTSAALFGGIIGAPLQHPAVLIGFAVVFVALSGASFGLYEIRAPQVLLARFGSSSAGIGGALLMGLTMGIVAAPCIGPVVLGLLVYVGAQRDVLRGFLLFLTMGLGMGLPYVVLASAAGSIGRLPRSGEWLRWMNRFFGVLLLGMALYFVAPLLPTPALRAAVVVLLATAGIYLGYLEPSGRTLRAFTAMRRVGGALVIGVAAWLVLTTSDPAAQAGVAIRWQPLTVDALDRAIAARKPAIVEFAAEWCLPCAVMAETTFVDPEVAREAKRFSMLQADVTDSTPQSETLLGRFQVLGVPTIIFYDASGSEVDRVVGYVDAARFAAMMRRVPSLETTDPTDPTAPGDRGPAEHDAAPAAQPARLDPPPAGPADVPLS